MRTRLLFLVICTLFDKGCTKNSSLKLSRLTDMLQYLCSGANVCHQNYTVQASQARKDSCCTECSCGSECEASGNCCFPSKQPYVTGNEDSDDVLQNGRVCLFPTTFDLQEKHKVLYQSYYMISAVSRDKIRNSSLSCGDKPVAPWGSLYPVYSAKRKKIYKNIACATEDDVTDGKSWDALFTCHLNRKQRPMDNFDFDSKNCHVSFNYQGKIGELQPHKCYRDVIDVCPDLGLFQITDEIGFSKAEVIEACTSGLTSPYRQEKMYANVFCHLCNEEQFAKESKCKEISATATFSERSEKSLVGLIDGDVFLTEGRTERIVKKPNILTVCKGKDKASCRPLHCPTGQLYDQSGNCKYPISVWYDRNFVVILNLTVEEDIKITGVLQRNDISALKSPWPRSWVISAIDYHIKHSNKNNTSVRVVLEREISAIRPFYLIESVKQMVKREWLLDFNNTTRVLKSDFETVPQLHMPDFIHLGNRTEEITALNYTDIYWLTHLLSKPAGQMITRMYFCNQVELTRSELILSEQKMVLFNVMTRRYMFPGEFSLILSDDIDDFRVGICIEDSGFSEVSSAAISYTNLVFGMFCIWFSFVARYSC